MKTQKKNIMTTRRETQGTQGTQETREAEGCREQARDYNRFGHYGRLDGCCGDGNEGRSETDEWNGGSGTEGGHRDDTSPEAKLLGLAEERRLVAEMRAGSIAARDQLFGAFRPLAVRIASRCFSRWRHGLEMGDLVAWAYIGLMRGLERYDVTRGARVSTCVTPYITKEVYRANANFGRLIRIPVNQTEKLTRYYDFVREFEAMNGVLPSMETVARALGVRGARLSHLVSVTASVQSLHAEGSDIDGGAGQKRYHDVVRTEAGILEKMMDRELMDEVFRALEAMDERDSLIVKKRFNLDGGGFCTLDAIAEKLDLTKERVRQLEKRALDRLRAAVA